MDEDYNGKAMFFEEMILVCENHMLMITISCTY